MADKDEKIRDTEENGDDSATATAEDVDSLKEAFEVEKEKAEKYLANWQRSEADLSNYKKRVEQEKAELSEFANAELIKSLLPVVDDLERALSNVPCGQEDISWIEGIRLIYRKLISILEAQGVAQIPCEGEIFNPNVHEAVMCVPGEEGRVVEEIQRGYTLRDRVIRPSMCKVGKNTES